MSKDPNDCLHMMLERTKEVKIVELHGHGILTAIFKCGTCGTFFYSLVQPTEHKSSES